MDSGKGEPDVDPIAVHLAWARQEQDKAAASWFNASFIDEDATVCDPSQRWTHTVRTLEAIQSAARLSRLLYGDCVELPSRDPAHLANPAVLHSLLMQQLNGLITRLGTRANTGGAVPIAVRPRSIPDELRAERTVSMVSTAAHRDSDSTEEEEDGAVPKEEEQGSTCTIA